MENGIIRLVNLVVKALLLYEYGLTDGLGILGNGFTHLIPHASSSPWSSAVSNLPSLTLGMNGCPQPDDERSLRLSAV